MPPAFGQTLNIHVGGCQNYGPFLDPFYYGTEYLGYPNRDPNFDNHPGTCKPQGTTQPCGQPGEAGPAIPTIGTILWFYREYIGDNTGAILGVLLRQLLTVAMFELLTKSCEISCKLYRTTPLMITLQAKKKEARATPSPKPRTAKAQCTSTSNHTPCRCSVQGPGT